MILLAVGRLVYLSGDLDKPLALVGKLCPRQAPRAKASWRQVWLAGEVLEEIGPNRVGDSALGQDLLLRTRRRLATLLEKGALTPVERAAAGRTLGRLGDPRQGVGVKAGHPDIEWVTVAGGPFLMGSDKAQDDLAYEDEMPQFTCDLLHQPYQISRYPITVAQYQTFVAAGGYDQQRYWTAEGWRWLTEGEITGPERYGGAYEIPNHPQVGVSWYEAVAFCCWLSAQNGITIRLPTEAEWERAARHTDGRIYTWSHGGKPGQHCNMYDTGIGSISAVGCFPSGNAESGAADMAGNVWEWCSTKWLEDYQNYAAQVDDALEGDARRVVRGGSFGDYQGDVRCAYRSRLSPDSRYSDDGFRVVRAPGL